MSSPNRKPLLLEDAKIRATVLANIAGGNNRGVAARAAGVAPQTLDSWVVKGRRDAERGEASVYTEFLAEMERAEAAAEVELVGLVRRAADAPQFWTAAMTLLERRHPERWRRRETTELITRAKEELLGPLEQILSDDQLEEVMQAWAAAS